MGMIIIAEEIRRITRNKQDWSICEDGTKHDGAVRGAVDEFAKENNLQVVVQTSKRNFPTWSIEKNKMADEKEKILLYDAIDSSILKSIPNPSKEPYEIKVKVPEFTFLGVNEQQILVFFILLFIQPRKSLNLKV